MKTKAFTLIEVLTVVRLLAVLTAIIFPVVASSRRKARQTQCISNLHQIGQASTMYRSDWDGFWSTTAAFAGDYDHGWWLPLQPYVKGNKEMLSCPAAVRSDRASIPDHIPGYAINGRLRSVIRGMHEGQVFFPATTVEFCDAPDDFVEVTSYDPWEGNVKRPDPVPDASWARHQGGANYLFCDEHVRWYARGAVQKDGVHAQDGTQPSFAVAWEY